MAAEKSQSGSLLVRSTEGAKFLILLQVASRALTFGVNQLLLRYLSPELLGISTQLEVYSISVLFFARESLRVAIQRQTDTIEQDNNISTKERQRAKPIQRDWSAQNTQAVVNLAYVSILLGVIFAFSLGWVYLRSVRSNPSVTSNIYLSEAVQLYGIAAFWELLSEPCFVAVQQKSEYKVRAAAESVATVLRCFVTCAIAVFATRNGFNIGVLPFAFGQWTYGLSLLIVYYARVRGIASRDGFSLTPRSIRSSKNTTYIISYFSRPLLALGISLFVQGVVKHLLTQGDVILISYLASLQAQGVYALASNYGGLVARMIFQPIEESSRSYFGKMLSSIERQPSQEVVRTASDHLHILLRAYVILSISAAAVGPTVAPMLLNIVAGPRWTISGAGNVLGKYCYYIPLLAMNGVTEAFISAVATESELNRQSIWMFAFSLGFAGAGWFFLGVLQLGPEGLVWANVINMALRILWSTNFIRRYLKRNGSRLSISNIMPHKASICVGIATTAILLQMQSAFTGSIWDLVQSCLVAGVYVILM